MTTASKPARSKLSIARRYLVARQLAATGITDGSLLDGVRWTERGPVTNSVVMRSESGTVRFITTEHGNRVRR